MDRDFVVEFLLRDIKKVLVGSRGVENVEAMIELYRSIEFELGVELGETLRMFVKEYNNL